MNFANPNYDKRKMLRLGAWLLVPMFVAIVVLLIDFALFWGCFAGWVNYDTHVQWEQVQTGVYTQWHPFVHTLLMMKMPSLLWNDYRASVIWQILWFSFAYGYMGWSLHRAGISRRWTCICLAFMLFHPQTLFFLMTPLKDTAFAVAVLISVAALVQVVCLGGKELRNKEVWVPLAVGLSLASLFRHNGIFFSIPVIVLLLLFYVRIECRGALRVIVAFVILMGAFKFGVPRMFDVRPASAYPEKYGFIESCGLPLSMMGAVYMKHPDGIPQSGRELLESIAPRKVWFGWANWSFSAIKHHGTARLSDERIAGYKFFGWRNFAGVFWETVKSDLRVAIVEGLKITGQVWNPAGHPKKQFWFPLKKLGFSDVRIQQLMPIVSFLSIPLVGIVGIAVWTFFFFSAWAFSKGSGRMFLLTLPLLGYDLGTMFFLSGYAVYRFFFVNVLVLVPIVLVAVRVMKREDGHE